MPPSFKAQSLEPLLQRLSAYKPDVITIEALSGESCELVKKYASIYPGASDYCGETETARTATGLEVTAAIVAVQQTLATWPNSPTAAERRRLVSLFASADDRSSALVQWLQLPKKERRTGNGVDQPLLELMNKLSTANNENYLIGAKLAAKLGLRRVYAVDDHTADSIYAEAGPGFEAAIQATWATSKFPYSEQVDKLKLGEDMLALFRVLNQAEVQRSNVSGDFGANLQERSKAQFGRQYVAAWETRNLRMVANIRSASANFPGARVLVIVGAMHRPYFEAYLAQLHDVDVVDLQTLLAKPD